MASTKSEAATDYGSTENLESGSFKQTDSLNSVYLTAGLIVADVVGAGILGLPVAVSEIGWLPSAVLIPLLLAMNMHISILMWRVRMDFPHIRSFVQMVDMAFSKAPEVQRQGMTIAAGICQYAFIFAMLGVYILCIGRALGNMFNSIHVCLPTWTLITCAIILPFQATARRLGTWRSLVWANVATICGTVFIPLLYMMHEGADKMRAPDSVFVAVAPLSFPNALDALSVFSFAFTSQFMVIEIISEMKDPSQFPTAYVGMAAPFQAIAFLLVGLGGYYYIGDKVMGMITDNIPFGPISQLAAACLLTHMVVTYLIKAIVLCRAGHRVVDKDADNDDSRSAWNTWTVLALLAALMAWLISSIVPFFNELVGLLGCTVCPICCYAIPIFCYLRWAKDFNAKDSPIGKLEGGVLVVELTLAAVLFTFGTYFAIVQILDKWSTFGYPFGCHCESMWSTCECSATHAGMLDQCATPTREVALQVQDMMDQNFAWMVPRNYTGMSTA